MVNSKGFILVEIFKSCDPCGLIKTKAKSISIVSNPLKKSSIIGESLIVDVVGPFPFAATHYHKDARNKLFW